jgi:hypothetical protein
MPKARSLLSPPGPLRLAALLVLLAGGPPAAAQVGWERSVVQGLFPSDAVIDKKTYFFERPEVRRIARASEAPMNSRLYTVFRARRGGQVLGYAAAPTVAVRAKPATLLIHLGAAGKVREVRILNWREGPRYRPSQAWLRQFRGASPDRLPRLGADIATGSRRQVGARVIVEAVRRFLTIYRLHMAETEFR